MIPAIDLTNGYRVNVTVGDLAVEYVLVYTTAPEDYDYGGITIYDSEGVTSRERDRFVLIPVNRVNEQFARNGSGLFNTYLFKGDNVDRRGIIDSMRIEEKLLKHMQGYRWDARR